LRDLTPSETNSVVRSLLGSAAIPDALLETIAETTQGNPFFIEEVINTLIEEGALRQVDGDWQLTRAMGDIHVPDTVQGVLAARIDRLGHEAKRLLQHAAIVGRIFWQQLLADLLGSDVDSPLAHLSEREFIRRLGRAVLVEDWEWIFRHALVQEVAYESVLKESRRQVHRQVAEWLEARAADRPDDLAPTLAYHFEQSQVWDKAIAFLAHAANRAKGLFAMRDALRLYDKALALAEAHAESVEKDTVLRLRQGRGGARALAGEFDGALADLQAVRGAAHAAGDADWERGLLSELGMIFRRLDDYDQSKALLREALELARISGDQRAAADILYHLGTVAWSEGKNTEAAAYHQEAVDICQTHGLTDLVAVQALHGRAEAYAFSAQAEKAAEFYTESLGLARQIGDRSYESENLQMLGGVNTGLMGTADLTNAVALAEESLAIARAAKLEWHVAPSLMTLGIALGEAGDYSRGIANLEECARFAESHGAHRFVSITLAWLGSLLLDLNLHERAISTLSKGSQAASAIGGGFWLPGLQSSLAVAHLRQGRLDVEPQLQEAYDLAKSRGQELLVLGGLEGLAELAVAQGHGEAAVAYADEMLALADRGGLRQYAASAHRWRGEALLASKAYETAEAELQRAAEMAEDIGRVRLSWDAHAALARLYRAQGQDDLVARHDAAVREIVNRIADNLQDADLRAGLPVFE
jgi:tetratricopeptide (TPR) repeat protein